MPSKYTEWNDKFLFFHLPAVSEVKSRWNLSKISDKLDDSLFIPSFDALEGSRKRCELLSDFTEFTLFEAGLSQA